MTSLLLFTRYYSAKCFGMKMPNSQQHVISYHLRILSALPVPEAWSLPYNCRSQSYPQIHPEPASLENSPLLIPFISTAPNPPAATTPTRSPYRNEYTFSINVTIMWLSFQIFYSLLSPYWPVDYIFSVLSNTFHIHRVYRNAMLIHAVTFQRSLIQVV